MSQQKEFFSLFYAVQAAIKIAEENAQIDGAHHKLWVIDQMLRVLLAENYSLFVTKYNSLNYPPWDPGIAP